MGEINFKMNISYGGGSMHDENINVDAKLTMFILWGVVLPLVVCIGLVGNILTMIVFWRKEMHSTTILYLRALVVTDTGILLGGLIFLAPISCAHYLQGEALGYFRDSVYPIIHTPGYFLVMTLQQCNVWITVSVSIERYIAICHPFRAARLISRRKTFVVIIAITLASLVYNVPHLFSTKAIDCPKTSGQPHIAIQTTDNNNTTTLPSPISPSSLFMSSTTTTPSQTLQQHSGVSPTNHCLLVTETSFGTSAFYKTYRTVMYGAIIYVIPFLALVIINSFLIKELMVMQRRRSGTNINEENEANLSLVLVLIVIVFIFCQTPGLVSQFDVIPARVFNSWLAVSNLMFTTNSAVNFLIYTAFGRKFRKVLLNVFRRVFNKSRKPSNSSYNRGWQFTTNVGNELTTVVDETRRPSEMTRVSSSVLNDVNNGTRTQTRVCSDLASKSVKGCNGDAGEYKPLCSKSKSTYEEITYKSRVNGDSENGVGRDE